MRPMINPEFSHAQLLSVLDYDAESGVFTNRINRRKARAGGIPGNISPTGYLQMTIFGEHCYAHRVAWFYMHGMWPPADIDHINHNRIDNSIANLRLVHRSENCRNASRGKNNTSGATGVYWCSQRRRWKCSIKKDGKFKPLGRYVDWFDAVCARKSAEARLGFHINHGQIAP